MDRITIDIQRAINRLKREYESALGKKDKEISSLISEVHHIRTRYRELQKRHDLLHQKASRLRGKIKIHNKTFESIRDSLKAKAECQHGIAQSATKN